jgi:O-antigen ligase
VYPSQYAFYLVQLVPVAVLLFLHAQSRLSRVALGAMLPLLVFSVYATQTRGAWVGLGVMLCIFLWFRARWSLLLVPLVAAALVIGVPSIRARLNEATQGTCVSATYCESSLQYRPQQWQDSLDLASLPELATIGAGFSSVVVLTGNYTHNEYVRLLVETGLIGLAAMMIVYWGLLRIAARGHREAATPFQRDLMLAFLAGTIARLVMAVADNIFVVVVLEWYFWAMAAVVVVESGAYQRFARMHEAERRAQSGAVPDAALPAAAPAR